jgi:hypothetical protein
MIHCLFLAKMTSGVRFFPSSYGRCAAIKAAGSLNPNKRIDVESQLMLLPRAPPITLITSFFDLEICPGQLVD